MPDPELRSLADALARARRLLQQHGECFISHRMRELEDRLSQGDATAISQAVAEATGSTGSLNDRYLCVENGDAVEPHEEAAVNARFRTLVKEVEQLARVAAAAHSIRLLR